MQAQLSDRYKKWLTEEVVYIIAPEEINAFTALTTDEERDYFIEQFWRRRNPDPASPENLAKTEHYRRLAYVNEHFSGSVPGWKTDRGRIFIRYGEPDSKETFPGGGAVASPHERWSYSHIAGVGSDIQIEFVDGRFDQPFERMARYFNVQHTPQESIPVRTRIPYRDGAILIDADKMEKAGQTFYASGKVRIAVEDITITADSAEYDSTTQTLRASGQTIITQGQSRAVGFRCEIHLDQHPLRLLIMK